MAEPAQGRWQRWALIVCLLWVGGCATYTDKLSKTHNAADIGDYEAGIRVLDNMLDVNGPEQLPDALSANKSLITLERAMLLQAQGQYEWSARDLSAAETELEFLDLSGDAVGSLGKYVYSDSARVYKVPPSERLALNALNMLNYLAMGDLQGASVEARRFTIARQYIESLAKNNSKTNPGAFGSYLAGFIFEKLGEPDRALRYYEETLGAGNLAAIREPVLRLSSQSRYKGTKLKDYLRVLEGSGSAAKNGPPASDEPDGEVLVILGLGRVPYKIPERMPIGAAIGYAGVSVTGNPEILTHTIFKFVVYPELTRPNSEVTGAAVRINGQNLPTELLTDLGAEIAREYETIKPKIIAAALSRMITRAVAAEGARYVAPKKEGKTTGFLAALFTEAALTALDKPDTRSWTFLPGRIYVCRTRVEPGQHEIQVQLAGKAPQTRTVQVDVPPGGYGVVVVTEPR